MCGSILHLRHDAEEISSPQFFEVVIGEAFGLQTTREVDEFGSRCQTRDSTIAIKVSADADVIHTCHLDHVEHMCHSVVDGGIFLIGAEETTIESALRHSARGCECTELVVSEIARMIAQHFGRRVTANDGNFGDCQSIVEGGFGSVGEVYHHAESVHFGHNFTTESGESSVFGSVGRRESLFVEGTGTCRVADFIVAIVAKGGIDNAALAIVRHIGEVGAKGIAIFDAGEDASQPSGFVGTDVLWGVGHAC